MKESAASITTRTNTLYSQLALVTSNNTKMNRLKSLSFRRKPAAPVAPPVEVPEVPAVPEVPVEVPKVEVPEVPKVEVPEVPKVEVPEVPKVEVPEVPEVEIPEVPKVEVPDLPEIEVPEIPKIEVPDVPSADDLKKAALILYIKTKLCCCIFGKEEVKLPAMVITDADLDILSK